MVPNPAVAAALGVWITDTPPARSPLRTVAPEYDPDDDDRSAAVAITPAFTTGA